MIYGIDAPNVKPLHGELKKYFRIRTGNYRIIFTYDKIVYTFISIVQRKNAYKKK